MKKILSLFVTIALLMVQFIGCQNMADIHIDPFEHPEEEPKHTVKLDYLKSMDLEFTTGEELDITLYEEKANHKFVGVTFVDANTDVVLDVPYDIKYNEEHKNYTVCFTMPDADIILKKFTIESVPVAEKDHRANYCVRLNDYDKITRNFKFAYDYIPQKIPEELKNVVKEVNDYTYIYEITDWIDNSKLCEPRAQYKEVQVPDWNTWSYRTESKLDYYCYYFYVSGLDDVVNSLKLMTEYEPGEYKFHYFHDNTFRYF